MGRTDCTESQCLYKGALYIYPFSGSRSLEMEKVVLRTFGENNTKCTVKCENICLMSLGITNKLSITHLFSYILQIYFTLFLELLHQLCSIVPLNTK